MSKLILFLVVVLLIGLVLFLSYKMDKNEVTKKRKEKIIKNNLKKDKEINDNLKPIEIDSLTEEDYSNSNQETMQINISDIKNKIQSDYLENEEIYEENLEDYTEVSDETEEENIIQEEIETEEDSEIQDDEEFIEDIEEPYYNEDDENLNEMTMLFNSNMLRSTEEILNDDNEDIELEELENEIAVANIKKYTRNKNDGIKLVSKKENPKSIKKENKNVKKYTRKKENKKENNETQVKKVKKYTRKKAVQQVKNDVKVEDKKDDKPKLKRGRPKKSDTPKRGRPKKVETPKRGRPKKTETPKRGRPKKTETSKSKK